MARSQNPFADHLDHLRTERSVPTFSKIAVLAAVTVSKWATRRRTRQALSQLTDAQLSDVGLTRAQALTEARRVFWQV